MYLVRYMENDNSKVDIGFMDFEREHIIPLRDMGGIIPEISKMDKIVDLIGCIDDDKLKAIEVELYRESYKRILASSVKFLPPIKYPIRNVFCVGKNYLDHAKELKTVLDEDGEALIPQKPAFFSKLAYPIRGDKDIIYVDEKTISSLDYEVELALIIGKKGKNIPPQYVKKHIFGYSIANDITDRRAQLEYLQWFKGKSKDSFASIGPYILLRDSINYPPDLSISSYVNGEIRQNSRTSMMMFDVDTIVSELSDGLTLYPGDIIITGTPAGVGASFKPAKTLHAGDEVVCQIENIGKLRNLIMIDESD